VEVEEEVLPTFLVAVAVVEELEDIENLQTILFLKEHIQ
jgi:hypothetical protein